MKWSWKEQTKCTWLECTSTHTEHTRNRCEVFFFVLKKKPNCHTAILKWECGIGLRDKQKLNLEGKCQKCIWGKGCYLWMRPENSSHSHGLGTTGRGGAAYRWLHRAGFHNSHFWLLPMTGTIGESGNFIWQLLLVNQVSCSFSGCLWTSLILSDIDALLQHCQFYMELFCEVFHAALPWDSPSYLVMNACSQI